MWTLTFCLYRVVKKVMFYPLLMCFCRLFYILNHKIMPMLIPVEQIKCLVLVFKKYILKQTMLWIFVRLIHWLTWKYKLYALVRGRLMVFSSWSSGILAHKKELLLLFSWNPYRQVGHGWPWLVMDGHGWSWLAMVGHGWSWLVMVDHGWPWLAMDGHGWHWSSFLYRSSFVTLLSLHSLSTISHSL